MKDLIEIEYLKNNDVVSINQIAKWYNHEWQTPIDKTIKILTQQPNNILIFQLILKVNGHLVSTVGLRTQVNILRIYPKFKKYTPWLALLYTKKEYRYLGYGKHIVSSLTAKAKSRNFSKIYLYTFSAEELYKKMGWFEINRIQYKGRDTSLLMYTV